MKLNPNDKESIQKEDLVIKKFKGLIKDITNSCLFQCFSIIEAPTLTEENFIPNDQLENKKGSHFFDKIIEIEIEDISLLNLFFRYIDKLKVIIGSIKENSPILIRVQPEIKANLDYETLEMKYRVYFRLVAEHDTEVPQFLLDEHDKKIEEIRQELRGKASVFL